MMNTGTALSGFLESFNKSIAGDIALSWIRSLPIEYEHQQSIVRAFNDFWMRGIVFAKEPQGKGITIGEFKELNDKDVEATIMSFENLSENQKYERIEYYKKFKRWVNEPWKKST